MADNRNYDIIIDEELAGTRMDLVLACSVPDVSRSFVQKLIEGGRVILDGELCKEKKRQVKEGQRISITVPEPELLEIKPENIPLDIRYEDDDVLVVYKPSGMVVHPAIGNYEGTLVNAVMYHCADSLSTINGVVRPGIVHRIDKDTSGLLMIAKNDRAHASLAKQLEEHSVTRRYKALVWDNIREDEGTVDVPIGRDRNNRLRMGVMPYEAGRIPHGARRAVTHFRVLERFGRCTLTECRLETGRTHQIRVHMAHIRHPLVGDALYGPRRPTAGAEGGQMLCACVLGFIHPSTGEYMEFVCDIPEDFEKYIEKLRKL